MIEQLKKFTNGYRVKGIKNIEGREGLGWSGTIYRNGKKIGTGDDYADGGPSRLRIPDSEEREALLKWAKELLPECQYEVENMFIEELVNYELAIKRMKVIARKKLMKYETDKLDTNGIPTTFSTWNFPDSPEVRTKILERYPDTNFLNDELADW